MKDIPNIRQKWFRTRLKGYHKHFRGRFLLLHTKYLTRPEFLLWDFLFSVAVAWGTENIAYTKVIASQREIAWFLNWSPGTVSLLMNSLIRKGLVFKDEDGMYTLTSFSEVNKRMKRKSVGIIDIQNLEFNFSDEEFEKSIDIDELIKEIDVSEHEEFGLTEVKEDIDEPP